MNQRGGRAGFIRVVHSDGRTGGDPHLSGNRFMTSLGNIHAARIPHLYGSGPRCSIQSPDPPARRGGAPRRATPSTQPRCSPKSSCTASPSRHSPGR
ncbi:hypothetical protein B0H10DRAFT_2092476, partial [Mycena sp. CBHHK59/15]